MNQAGAKACPLSRRVLDFNGPHLIATAFQAMAPGDRDRRGAIAAAAAAIAVAIVAVTRRAVARAV
jgi:hypothetical protein